MTTTVTTSQTETAQELIERFASFVKDNRATFEPFRIILEQPEQWHSGYASTLLDIFGDWRLFPLAAFRSAYREVHGIENVDPVSAVKRAVNANYGLMTIEERSLRAIRFALEHTRHRERHYRWLERFDRMLQTNPAIRANDIDELPEYRQAGGIAGARRALRCDVFALVDAMNEGVARD